MSILRTKKEVLGAPTEKTLKDYGFVKTIKLKDKLNLVHAKGNKKRIHILHPSDFNPENEYNLLIMIDGQNIAFALDGWDSSKQKVYLGIKAPMGGAKVIVNGHEIAINNTKECYYDITNFVTLEQNNEGRYIPVIRIEAADGLISITNIRVTGQAEFAIIPDELI